MALWQWPLLLSFRMQLTCHMKQRQHRAAVCVSPCIGLGSRAACPQGRQGAELSIEAPAAGVRALRRPLQRLAAHSCHQPLHKQ